MCCNEPRTSSNRCAGISYHRDRTGSRSPEPPLLQDRLPRRETDRLLCQALSRSQGWSPQALPSPSRPCEGTSRRNRPVLANQSRDLPKGSTPSPVVEFPLEGRTFGNIEPG